LVHPKLCNILGWLVVILVALLVATGTRAYAIQTCYVPTASMSPTLMPGDRIIVDKLAGSIHRGDIVVFRNVPADQGGPPTLVKRVVGLPGDVVSGSGNQVFIDGKPLAQPWLPPLTGNCRTTQSMPITTTKITADHYFVMGDCRAISDDSRYWGTVPASNIIGKVEIIAWRNGHPWFHWF